jgi:hypothetical protein
MKNWKSISIEKFDLLEKLFSSWFFLSKIFRKVSRVLLWELLKVFLSFYSSNFPGFQEISFKNNI